MARGRIGSYVGTAQAGVDMIPILAQGKAPTPQSTGFAIRKIGISSGEGVAFTLNDAEIVLTSTGVFETSEDMIEVKKLVFHETVDVNIRYLY